MLYNVTYVINLFNLIGSQSNYALFVVVVAYSCSAIYYICNTICCYIDRNIDREIYQMPPIGLNFIYSFDMDYSNKKFLYIVQVTFWANYFKCIPLFYSSEGGFPLTKGQLACKYPAYKVFKFS